MRESREASRKLSAALSAALDALSSALCVAYPAIADAWDQDQAIGLHDMCAGPRHRRAMLSRASEILSADALGRIAGQDITVRDAVAVLRAACLDAHEIEQHAVARRRIASRERHAVYTGLGMARTRDGRYE